MDSACSKTLLAGIARARIPPSLSPAPDSQTREWDILFTPSGYIDQVVPSSRAPTGDHNGLNPVTGVGNPEEQPSSPPLPLLDAAGRLVTPSLCHAHVHLDKAFLNSDDRYADLGVKEGTFEEAMEVGRVAKGRFDEDELERRGGWLIAESIAAGVTHMRVFVEVDHAVGFKCLDAAIALKDRFRACCEIQICAFAQDPLLSGPHAEKTRELWLQAVLREEVEVLGTTPYVEAGEDETRRNLDLAVRESKHLGKHLDFHMDYNLDSSKPVVTNWLLDILEKEAEPRKTVVLGHCTRLALFTHDEWAALAARISNLKNKKTTNTQISFIGLPTSDLFIQGRPPPGSESSDRPRGTLQIPALIQRHGLNGAIAVNNVGNAFTPHGCCDPLALASWCVGVYQAAAPKDLECLFECVSSGARSAVGFPAGGVRKGESADLVVYGLDVRDGDEVAMSRRRPRCGLRDLVGDPPGEREVVFQGAVVKI